MIYHICFERPLLVDSFQGALCQRWWSLAGAEAEAVTLSPVARLLTKLSPFKGCSRSPLSLALGARANCRTSSLCSPDWWCNKTYLCFQKCRSNGNDDTGRHIWRMVEPEFPSCISLFTFPIADIQVSDLYSHSSNIHSVTRASWTRQACSSHWKLEKQTKKERRWPRAVLSSHISETFQSPQCPLSRAFRYLLR